ncbi:MAG: hypothetical protein Q4P78_05315 [Rothia sp. (in: high G+C Gram-positive bacteria)]|uniref:hypothetical protein n=1 Tax=Rothia sp. (in: high G+C Gram-positive bacteria) TaxID=1885016 RepID=UPI0026E0EBD1|nr:hypothetical protein [Rothia sp. (in: high G+C Gram-positive bacteria)]MDO5750605.1 hypothetical protein [Rothia sp. (in: high G+C Gram-positive bacteria)]
MNYINQLVDSITDTEYPGLILDDEGPYELLTCDLPILAKNPSIPLDAEAFVDFAVSVRLDWEDEEERTMTDSIREINKRPDVAAVYKEWEIPPVESNESYVWLDKVYGRPPRVLGNDRYAG